MKKEQTGIQKLLKQREFTLLLVIVGLSFLISLFSEYFLTSANILSMSTALTVEGIIVIGMVLLLIIGGLDLSVGAVMAFTGVITAMMINAQIPVVIAIILGLIMATMIGVVNGILIAKMKLNAFITTLGMMMVVKGLMLVISNGRAVLNMPAAFKALGQTRWLGIQVPVYIMIILVILMDLLLRNMRMMRQGYFVGNNEVAAKLNGINTDGVKISFYALSSFFAGIAGVLITARFGNASVTLGDSTAMNVITAAIIGGASLGGGQGTVLGAFLGAVFMQLISTSLNMLGVNMYWQNFATGSILIAAILADSINEMRRVGRLSIK